jgi:hypothetical protein
MRNEVQVRGRIFSAVETHCAGSDLSLKAFCEIVGVSPSMLYKFRAPGGPYLGRDTVTALAPSLPDIPADVWLEAMGVPPAESAGAEAAP